MKIIGIIPARGGSKGIIKKNIVPLKGKPLISYMIEEANQSEYLDELYVATDCEEIKKTCSELNVSIYHRSKESSTDEASSEMVLLEFCEKHPSDILVFLQCTAPFTNVSDIDGTIKKVIEGADSALAASEFHHFLWDETGNPLSHQKDKRLRRQDFDQYLESGSVYVMKTDMFLKHKHRFFGNTELHIIPKERTFEIDTPIELKIAENIIDLIKEHNEN